MLRACHVIRGDQEWIVHAERDQLAERAKSPEARRRFAAKLRASRDAEDLPIKTALKAATDQNVSPEERARIARSAVETIKGKR
jgi:hypothetical protein